MNYPLYVSVVDPFKKKNSKIYYFLGDIPNDILNAAKAGTYNKQKEVMEWQSSDKKILKDYYGANWYNILTGEEPVNELNSKFNFYKYVRSAANKMIVGGGDTLFGDLSIFDEDVLVSTKESFESTLLFTSPEKIVYTNLSTYPEDNLYDLRLKIQLITKIPIYRQFLFYYLDDYGPYYTYQITVNRIPYTINWTEIFKKYDLVIDNIGIDIYFEQNKNEIEIISYDKSILLESKGGHKINKVYIIDLFDILKNKNISDKYHFNLLYYGFVIKFWPQINPDVFRLAMSAPDQIYKIYPQITFKFEELYRTQTIEQELFNKVHRYSETFNDQSVITNASIVVNPSAIKMNINIRNIFDKLVLNSKVNAMFMNVLYGIRKQYYIQKRYASVLNQNFLIDTPKNTISICIEGDQQIVLILSKSGAYEVSTKWLEDDKINFDNIIKTLSVYVNPVIDSINSLGIYVFPNGGQINRITKEAVFNLLTVSIYYPFSFSTHEFNMLKNAFKKYEELNIIKIYGLQVSRIFTFVFYRGVLNNNFIYDGYNWLYDNSQQSGRRIRLIHRTDRLQIEINNVQSIDEFNIIKKYLFSLVYEFIRENKLKSVRKSESKLKAIRKLHDLDPELFNLTKYDPDATTYSVLCQSQRQPQIYDEDDIKSLSKEKNGKIVKYWNFTYNRPAYYLCEGKYQYINFIVDKHPKNYCLPCCKKLKDIPNTDVATINKHCLENRTYKTEKIESSYILAYGKTLSVGRKSHVPGNLKYLLPEHFIFGVKQVESNDTNIGFIESIKFLLGPGIIKDLASLVKEMDQYYTLANGKAIKYKSSHELHSELLSNFELKNNMLLTNIDMLFWKHVLCDLIRYKLDIEVLEIVYNETCMLHSYEPLNTEEIIILFTDEENGTNPIIGKGKVFHNSMCKYLFKERIKRLNLNYILTFAEKTTKNINKLFINLKGKCYAVLIDDIYIPVVESSYHSVTADISYDVRPEPTFSRNKLCSLLNEFYKDVGISIEYIITNSGKGIGFFDSTNGLVFYYKPEEHNYSDDGIESMLQKAHIDKKHLFIPYDLRSIDSAILKRNIVRDISKTGLIKKLENNYYNLFLSEFTHKIQNEKNEQIRNSIKHIISTSKHLDSKIIQKISQQLSELLSDYPIDLLIIYDFIESAYFNSLDIKSLESFINSSKFEFDFQVLHDLKNIKNKSALIKKLKEIMADSYIFDEIKDIPQHYNIFTSCAKENNQFFCKDNKLIIPKEKIDDFFDVLSNDILNKSKTYIIMSASSGIFNYFDFIKRPYEFIEITENKL